jgi:hypothetical protein
VSAHDEIIATAWATMNSSVARCVALDRHGGRAHRHRPYATVIIDFGEYRNAIIVATMRAIAPTLGTHRGSLPDLNERIYDSVE